MALLGKVKSSSLLETVVALTILTLVSSIVSVAMVRATQTSLSGQKTKAVLISEELIAKFKAERNYLDEQIELDGFIIEKSVAPFEGSVNLFVLKVRVLDKDEHCLNSYREVISK